MAKKGMTLTEATGELFTARGRIIELERSNLEGRYFALALIEVCKPTTEQIVEAAKLSVSEKIKARADDKVANPMNEAT